MYNRELWRESFAFGSISVKQLSSNVEDFDFVRSLRCVCSKSGSGDECNISMTKSDSSRAGIPSMRKPASKDTTFESDEL